MPVQQQKQKSAINLLTCGNLREPESIDNLILSGLEWIGVQRKPSFCLVMRHGNRNIYDQIGVSEAHRHHLHVKFCPSISYWNSILHPRLSSDNPHMLRPALVVGEAPEVSQAAQLREWRHLKLEAKCWKQRPHQATKNSQKEAETQA